MLALAVGGLAFPSVPARAADDCDLEAVAIPSVADLAPVDLDAVGDASGRSADLRGIAASDLTVLRAWGGGGERVVQVFLSDDRSPEEARSGLGHTIAGFQESLGAPPVASYDLPALAGGVGSVFRVGGATFVLAGAAVGRVEVLVTVGVPGEDEAAVAAAEEEAAAVLAEQADRVTPACRVAADQPAGPDQRRQQLIGGVTGALGLLVGGGWVVARMRTGGRDTAGRAGVHPGRRVALPPGQWVRDISGWADVRRRRASFRFAFRLFGLYLVMVASIDLIEPGGDLWVGLPLGLAVMVLIPRSDRLVIRGDAGPQPPREVRWVRHGANPPLAVLLLGGAVVAAGVAALGLLFQVRLVGASDNQVAVAAARLDVDTSTYRSLGILLLLGAVPACWGLHRWARIASQRGAMDLVARDPRPPVLLLRAFGDDDLRIRVTPARRHSLLGRLGLVQVERFEELLAWSLASYGPVTAVAQPGRRLRPLGAARESLQDETWLPEVVRRMGQARFVVVVVGTTAGLQHEVAAVRDSGLLHRTVFVIPPVSAAEAAARWWVVATVLGPALVAPYPFDPTDPIGVLVGVAGGRVVRYAGPDRRDVTYETAIDVAVADGLGAMPF